MATATKYDISITIETLSFTHSLSNEDAGRIYDTGEFVYVPPPLVEYERTGDVTIKEERERTVKERISTVSSQIGTMLEDLNKILKVFSKRASGIVLEYDPEDQKNESLANAEESIFGGKSGQITYAKYEQVLGLEQKIDKWLAQSSMANGGKV